MNHLDAGEQGAGAKQLTCGAEYGQYPHQAESHHHRIDGGAERIIFGGKCFDAGKHDAVGDDQRNEDPQHQIEIVEKGVEHQIDDGGEGSDDEDEHRNANFVRNEFAQRGDGEIRQGHHEHRGQTEAGGIDHAGADGKDRAQAEQLGEAGVLFPQTVVGQLTEFLQVHGCAPKVLPVGAEKRAS